MDDMPIWLQVLGILLTFLGGLISSWFAFRSQVHAKQANRNSQEVNAAVNCQPPGSPRLVEVAITMSRQVGAIEQATKQNTESIAELRNEVRSLSNNNSIPPLKHGDSS